MYFILIASNKSHKSDLNVKKLRYSLSCASLPHHHDVSTGCENVTRSRDISQPQNPGPLLVAQCSHAQITALQSDGNTDPREPIKKAAHTCMGTHTHTAHTHTHCAHAYHGPQSAKQNHTQACKIKNLPAGCYDPL